MVYFFDGFKFKVYEALIAALKSFLGAEAEALGFEGTVSCSAVEGGA